MPDDFDEVTAAVPMQEAARDKRRPKKIIVELDEDRKVVAIEIQYAGYSSVDGDLVEKDGANCYMGANADVLKGRIFKAGARAELATRLAEDRIDSPASIVDEVGDPVDAAI